MSCRPGERTLCLKARAVEMGLWMVALVILPFEPPVSLKALPLSEVGLTVALHSAPRLSLCMPRVCCALETSQEHVRDRQVLPGDKTLERSMF